MSHDHDCENINAPVGMERPCGCEDRRRSAEPSCCEKYDSCTRDCIPRLHWHDERRTLRPEEARAADLWTLWWKMYRGSESGNRMVCDMAAALDKTPQELSPTPQTRLTPEEK